MFTCHCWYNVHNKKTSTILVFKVIRYHHELPCTLNSVVFELSFYLLFLKSIMMTLWVCSFGDDLDHDQWSKTTHMVHQRNRWICDQRGFISSFDAPWCTTDPDHPKEMHPLSLLNFLLNLSLSLQFKYMNFHSVYALFFFTIYRYITNLLTKWSAPSGLIAQLLEHCTGIG